MPPHGGRGPRCCTWQRQQHQRGGNNARNVRDSAHEAAEVVPPQAQVQGGVSAGEPSCKSTSSSPSLHSNGSSAFTAPVTPQAGFNATAPERSANQRWCRSFIRVDSRVQILPAPVEQVTVPPPSSSFSPHPHSHAWPPGFGNDRRSQDAGAAVPGSKVKAGAGAARQESVPREASSDRKDRVSKSKASAAEGLATFSCNIHVNLKSVGFRDTDIPHLTCVLEDFLSSVTASSTPVSVHLNRQQLLASSPSNQQKQKQQKQSRAVDHRSANSLTVSSRKNGLEASGGVFFISLDLSENNLTCQGIQQLAKWFVRNSCRIRLRVLKVYKNFISDNGALALADLIAKQPSALEELHLSHNRIKTAGADALFKSIGQAKLSSSFAQVTGKGSREFIYPRPDPKRQEFLPVWIRLEYNNIVDAHSLLQKWEQETRAARSFDPSWKLICFADRPNHPHGSKDPHCSPARCLRSVNGHAALLHLYSFYHQTPCNTSALTTLRRLNAETRGKGRAEATVPAASVSNRSGDVLPATAIPKKHFNRKPEGAGTAQLKKKKREKRVPNTPRVNEDAVPTTVVRTRVELKPPSSVQEKSHEDESKNVAASIEVKETLEPPPTAPVPQPLHVTPTLQPQPVFAPVGNAAAKDPLPSDPATQLYFSHELEGASKDKVKNIVTAVPFSPKCAHTAQNISPEGQQAMTSALSFPENVSSEMEDRPGAAGNSNILDSAVIEVGRVRQRKPVESFLVSSQANREPEPTREAVVWSLLGGRKNLDSSVAHTGDTNLQGNVSASSKTEHESQHTSFAGRTPVTASLNGLGLSRPSSFNEGFNTDPMATSSSMLANMIFQVQKASEQSSKQTFSYPNTPSFRSQNELSCASVSDNGFSSAGASFPLFVFMDASAFVEMRILFKKDKVNLFSFPALYALHQLQTSDESNASANGHITKRDHGVVLMCLDAVGDGIEKLTEKQLFLRQSLAELQKEFVQPLTQQGLIEKVSGCGDKRAYPEWMTLDQDVFEQAKLLEDTAFESLRVFDFACVWGFHMGRLATALKSGPQFQDASYPAALHPFSLFITADPKVEMFCKYLTQRYEALERAKGRGPTPAGSRPPWNLICTRLDRLNRRLCEAFPDLVSLIYDHEAFKHHRQTTPRCSSTAPRGFFASALRDLLRRRLSTSGDLILDPTALIASLTGRSESSSMPSLSSFAPPDKIFSAQFPPEEINEAAVRREGFEQYHSKLAASGRRNSATMIEQEMQDLRKMNQQLREEVRRAYHLLKDVVEVQLPSQYCEESLKSFKKELLNRCVKQCQNWELLLLDQAGPGVPTHSALSFYDQRGHSSKRLW